MVGLVLLKPNLQLDFGLLNIPSFASHCSALRSKHDNRGRLLDHPPFWIGAKENFCCDFMVFQMRFFIIWLHL